MSPFEFATLVALSVKGAFLFLDFLYSDKVDKNLRTRLGLLFDYVASNDVFSIVRQTYKKLFNRVSDWLATGNNSYTLLIVALVTSLGTIIYATLYVPETTSALLQTLKQIRPDSAHTESTHIVNGFKHIRTIFCVVAASLQVTIISLISFELTFGLIGAASQAKNSSFLWVEIILDIVVVATLPWVLLSIGSWWLCDDILLALVGSTLETIGISIGLHLFAVSLIAIADAKSKRKSLVVIKKTINLFLFAISPILLLCMHDRYAIALNIYIGSIYPYYMPLILFLAMAFLLIVALIVAFGRLIRMFLDLVDNPPDSVKDKWKRIRELSEDDPLRQDIIKYGVDPQKVGDKSVLIELSNGLRKAIPVRWWIGKIAGSIRLERSMQVLNVLSVAIFVLLLSWIAFTYMSVTKYLSLLEGSNAIQFLVLLSIPAALPTVLHLLALLPPMVAKTNPIFWKRIAERLCLYLGAHTDNVLARVGNLLAIIVGISTFIIDTYVSSTH
jgi:hypothetical protein